MLLRPWKVDYVVYQKNCLKHLGAGEKRQGGKKNHQKTMILFFGVVINV
jgi:hypothetical protein